MMKNTVKTGFNRTGTNMSPIDEKSLIERARATVPSSEGDASAIDTVRADYLDEGATIGSLAPPATVKGAAHTVVSAAQGKDSTVFFDKLGERLAFERTGTRLYAAVLGKLDASEPLADGPSRRQLEDIMNDELRHFEMLREVILDLGGDPTAITPSADVAGVSGAGLLQVIGDPRMNLPQSLEALLVAELVDNDGWELLVDLAAEMGKRELAERFEAALDEEARHLSLLREWVASATRAGSPAST